MAINNGIQSDISNIITVTIGERTLVPVDNNDIDSSSVAPSLSIYGFGLNLSMMGILVLLSINSIKRKK